MITIILLTILGITIGGIVYLRWEIKLPALTGPYKVGKISYNLTDKSRRDILSDDPDRVRDLMVTIYYPSEPANGEKPSPYTDKAIKTAIPKASGIPGFIFSNIKSNSYKIAPVSQEKTAFPMLLFSPGMDSQFLFHTSLIEEIASHGYIIAAVSHPYKDMFTVYPDGRLVCANNTGTDEKNRPMVVKVCGDDMMFVLDQLEEINRNDEILKNHMDLANTGIFGHSFGGATAVQVAIHDKRIKAGVDMDGTLWGDQAEKKFDQPFMFMVSRSGGPVFFVNSSEFKHVFKNSEECFLMYLVDSGHHSFATDIAFISERYRFLPLGDLGKIPAKKALKYISKYTIAFFDKHLKGVSPSPLDSNEPIEDDCVGLRKYDKKQINT